MLIRRLGFMLFSFFFEANYGSPGTAIYIEKILFNFHEILLRTALASLPRSQEKEMLSILLEIQYVNMIIEIGR